MTLSKYMERVCERLVKEAVLLDPSLLGDV